MDRPPQSITQFQRDLAALRQHLAALAASDATGDVTAALQTSLEELRVAEEELRQQHEALLATRQTLEAVRAHYEALFALAPEAYVVTNAMGIIREANQTAVALLGRPLEDLVGTPLLRFIVPQDRKAFHAQMARVMRDQRVYAWEIHIQPFQAPPFPADITITVSQEVPGTETTLLWLLRDLTERQKLEAERRHTEHLALLGTLAASVSHEIRTPLSTISLYTEFLEEEVRQHQLPAALQARMLEALAEIHTGGRRMHNIIEDYLALARGRDLQREPADLGAVLTAFVEDVQLSCATRGITLCCKGLADLGVVPVHPSTFRRAVFNLVQNAIDAMPEGGTLTLCGQQHAAQLTLEVCDTGSGIPAEQVPLLFTPLHTTKAYGTGLGLYVVQEIIAAHGGTLAVQSAPGRGTTFTITLPRAPATP